MYTDHYSSQLRRTTNAITVSPQSIRSIRHADVNRFASRALRWQLTVEVLRRRAAKQRCVSRRCLTYRKENGCLFNTPMAAHIASSTYVHICFHTSFPPSNTHCSSVSINFHPAGAHPTTIDIDDLLSFGFNLRRSIAMPLRHVTLLLSKTTVRV